jgi:hypothetical protein
MRKELISLLILLVLLAGPTFAQDILTTISSILTPFIGVIFILIFILILLAVGGVLPKPKGRLPFGLIAFFVLIILLFIIPQFIEYPQYLEVPESFKYWELPPAAKDALQLIGLPREWGWVPAILYLFVLPFAAIYTLVWAFLWSLEIFPKNLSNVNRILALIITFMTIPIGWFTKIVWVLFSFMGIWSVVIFAAVFILGVFFKGFGITSEQYYSAMGKRWRNEARRHLNDATSDISNARYGDAINHLRAAQNFAGFHPDYYTKITNAINALSATPPNINDARTNINEALRLI